MDGVGVSGVGSGLGAGDDGVHIRLVDRNKNAVSVMNSFDRAQQDSQTGCIIQVGAWIPRVLTLGPKDVSNRKLGALEVCRLVPSLNSLPSAFALLCLLACSSGAQSIEEEGAQLGKDITAAIVQPIGSRSAPPTTLVIDRCEVTIEFKYAYSCSEPSRIASEHAFFNLNDVAYIDLIEISDQSLLLFTYWPEVKQVRQAGSNIIRSMYAISPYPADDLALNLLITERVGEFLESSTISVRSNVTYCSGASRPSFYPTDSAQIFIAQAKARALGKRLGAFIQDNCREKTGD